MLERSVLALPSLFAHLVRRTWLVAVVTVALCAALAAHAVAAFVEADYLAPPPQGRPILVAPSKVAADTLRKRPDANGFVERNMFCSTCGPIAESGPAGVAYSGTPAILIATSVGFDARATVRVPSTEVQGSWGIGESIPGVGMVDRIGFTSIDVIDSAGRRGKISLLEAAATGSAGAATPAAPAAAWGDRVHRVDDSSYEVDRSLVKELVTGSMKPNGVRVTPAMANGEITGLRFAGVTAQSIPAAIGLKSGDVMSTLDGTPIKTAEALLDVYTKLDSLSSVELGGTRGGKPLAIKLFLR